MAKSRTSAWPVLTSYDSRHLRRIALPLGGIGTGTVSLGGRGDLRDWEICNRPAKGFIPPGEGRIGPFFAVWVKPKGGKAIARALEGPIDPEDYEGQMGASIPNHGLPRFRKCSFDAAYPFGQVRLSDPDMPIDARLEAFNPLVPADDEASSLPVAVLRYVLTNKTSKPVEATVCGMVPNFIGADGSFAELSGFGNAPSFANRMKGNRNEFRRAAGLHGVFMHSTELDKFHEAWGTIALSVVDAADKDVSHRTSWARLGWGDTALDFWDDLLEDGRVSERDQDGEPSPKGTLARSLTIPPRGTKSVTFLITWHFPNRMSWHPAPKAKVDPDHIHASTPFVMRLRVSDFQRIEGTIDSAPLPADWGSVNLRMRGFEPGPSGQFIDLHDEILARPRDHREMFYAVSRVRCDEPMKIAAVLGYDGPVKVWVDGKPQFVDVRGTNPSVRDEVRVTFDASAGEHEVVIAFDTNGGAAWGMYLRYHRTDVSRKQAERGGVVLPVLVDMPSAGLSVLGGDANTSSGGGTAPCCEGGSCGDSGNPDLVGNHYTTQFRDAWDVAVKIAPRLASLETRSLEFVRAFCDTDLPEPVKEAALYNVSTLRSQTTFRTADGLIFGWEGCFDRGGCCHGSCTHVWNYENAVGFLFGKLSRIFRHVELHHSTDDRGVMAFRTGLPISRAKSWLKAAADGQMGALMRFHRDWKLSGDDAFLREHYPKARLALSWCWAPGGWDADQDGVMEGCQHNTMDVEYYGPNPQMQFWYLGAMRAMEVMARHLGDNEFADRCRDLFERGSKFADEKLFNGEYYEHHIAPLPDGDKPAPETVVGMGAKDPRNPDFQLGAGCLVDQLVGQYMAHATGLGYLAKPENIDATCRAIFAHNFKGPFHDHFNHLRSYVLGDESALLMATYPRGRRPKSPFPYYNEVMTGFEYTAAVGMLFEGQTPAGLKCIAAIRERYDGRKRNPFNEAECGHHYARAMASWSAVLALTGFQYDAVRGTIEFAAPKKNTTWFWSTGDAWGTVQLAVSKTGIKATLEVLHGTLHVTSLRIKDIGEVATKQSRLHAGKSVTLTVTRRRAK